MDTIKEQENIIKSGLYSPKQLFNEAPRGKQRGILKQNQLFTLMQNNVFFLKPLVSNIFRDTRFISKFTNRIHKISICPKFTTPQFLFYFRMFLEYFSCNYTFYHPDYLARANFGNRLNQKMNMIIICPNLKKMNLVSLLNLKTGFFQSHINCFTDYNPSIFRWTNIMIQQNCCLLYTSDAADD